MYEDARYVYQHEGRKSLGKGPMLGIFGAGEWVRSKGHAMKSQWNAAMAAVDLMQVSNLLRAKATSFVMLIWTICTWTQNASAICHCCHRIRDELATEAVQPSQKHHFAHHE